MQRDDAVVLDDMLRYARLAVTRMGGKTRAEFNDDVDLQDASVRRVQVIGEAARVVSDSFKQAHPEIPWDKITGMRHRMVHDYRRIDLEVVWRVVTEHLPPLISFLEKLDLK